jgi:hypothetical protein
MIFDTARFYRKNKEGPPIKGGLAFLALFRTDVNRSELSAVLGIGFGIKADLLAFVQGFETLGHDCGEMYENIAAAVVVGDKSESLFIVEPLDCTFHKAPP